MDVQRSGKHPSKRVLLLVFKFLSHSFRYQLVEKHLLEFSQLALHRPDFQKSDDMFNRVMTKDNIAMVLLLENRITGSRLIVANIHIHWDAQFRDVKLVQVGMLMPELEKLAHQFAKLPPKPPAPPGEDGLEPPRPQPPTYSDGLKIPMIVCGDFNSVPDSGVYEFLNTGVVPKNHPDFMTYTYGDFTTSGMKHNLSLSSSYASIGELPLTNYTPTFKGPIDYIWYTTNTLTPGFTARRSGQELPVQGSRIPECPLSVRVSRYSYSKCTVFLTDFK